MFGRRRRRKKKTLKFSCFSQLIIYLPAHDLNNVDVLFLQSTDYTISLHPIRLSPSRSLKISNCFWHFSIIETHDHAQFGNIKVSFSNIDEQRRMEWNVIWFTLVSLSLSLFRSCLFEHWKNIEQNILHFSTSCSARIEILCWLLRRHLRRTSFSYLRIYIQLKFIIMT